MKLFACFLLLGAALNLTFAEEEIKLDEGVLVLTEGNFDTAVTDNKYVLVEFCKYCHFLLFQNGRWREKEMKFPLFVPVGADWFGSEWEQWQRKIDQETVLNHGSV